MGYVLPSNTAYLLALDDVRFIRRAHAMKDFEQCVLEVLDDGGPLLRLPLPNIFSLILIGGPIAV